MPKRLPVMLSGALCALGLLASAPAFAQTDTITVKNHKLRVAYLKPGVRQYLVTIQMPGRSKVLNLQYWIRNTQIITRGGQKLFTTTQHWFGTDTASYRTFYSLNRATDFTPVYHAETSRGKVRAYNWNAKTIKGADTVANNDVKDFAMEFTEPNFNWNLDIETFAMLPLAEGKSFAINFYDAGIGKPAYVLYQVTGSDVITLLDNSQTDCWKLFNTGKAPNGTTYTQTFWLSKKSHEFLKEEDDYNGIYRTKIKLPSTMPDIMARFKRNLPIR
jgi:hypothetical protein